MKHGIFSQAALLKGESRAKLDSLLSGLRDDCKPEKARETLLVDKLAALAWLERRVITMVGEQTQGGLEATLRQFAHSDQPLDILLRYQAHLDRSFDRALAQLERLQRLRKGQPVPPTLNVNVST